MPIKGHWCPGCRAKDYEQRAEFSDGEYRFHCSMCGLKWKHPEPAETHQTAEMRPII